MTESSIPTWATLEDSEAKIKKWAENAAQGKAWG